MAEVPDRVNLQGSERAALPDARVIGQVAEDEAVRFTVVLRCRAELPAEVLAGGRHLSLEQLGADHGPDPAEMQQVADVLTGAGVTIVEADPGSRRIVALGSAGRLAHLFGTTLQPVESASLTGGDPSRHRQRTGSLSIPRSSVTSSPRCWASTTGHRPDRTFEPSRPSLRNRRSPLTR